MSTFKLSSFWGSLQWLIVIFVFLLIICVELAYLYFTDRLNYLFKLEWDLLLDNLSKLEKWFLSGSILSIIILGMIINWLSKLFFKNIDKKIIENVDNSINQTHSGTSDNIGRDKIENIKKINSFALDGNNNLVIQGVDKCNVTVNINIPFNEFALKFTKEKDRKIEGLYQSIKELRQLSTYKDTDILNLSHQIEKLKNEKETIGNQVQNLINEAEKTDFSKMSDLYRSAYQEFLQGRIDEALEILNETKLKKQEETTKQKRKQEDFQLAKNRILRAQMLVIKFRFNEAEKNYAEAIKISHSADNLFQFAFYLLNQNKFTKAHILYEEALQIYRILAQRDPNNYLHNVADTLNNLAISQKANNRPLAAHSHYKEALQIYRDLAKDNPSSYLSNIATTLHNLANLQKDKNEFVGAQKKFEEALQIYRGLAKENPRDYLPDLATILNNLASLQKDKNEFAASEKNFEKAMQICKDLAKENSSSYLPRLATTLNNFALLHHGKNEFSQALEKYEESLKIRRKLAEENPNTYLPDVAMTLNNLANLHLSKNEFPQALKKYEEALQIYRDLAKENSSSYLPDVAGSLNNLAVLHSIKNEFVVAQERYKETLQIRRVLAKDNPNNYLPDVAQTVLNLSIFYLHAVPDKEKSIKFAQETISIAKQFLQIPQVQQHAEKALQILRANGIDVEELGK